MAVIITDRDVKRDAGNRPLWRRLIWFAALWGLGVLTIFVVGTTIRYFMFP